MTTGQSERLRTVHRQLIKAAQTWALRQGFDPGRARELRREAILINHAHYIKTIPAYQRLAQEEGVSEVTDIETIKKKLMSTDDVFKSYNQEWLEQADFGQMNQWLSGIYHKRIDVDVQGVRSIDDWIERLRAAGTNTVYSSGTSGTFSFVPRDETDWALVKTANTVYLTPLLTYRKVGTALVRLLVKPAIRLLSPDTLVKAVNKAGLPDFDGFFLGFRQGNMGNQVLIRELAPLFRRHHFLYDIDLTAAALRCLRWGAQTEEDRQLLGKLQKETIVERDSNYLKVIGHIKTSVEESQKVFLFGAPYQFKELGEIMSGENQRIALKKGSIILFGGGWKSFTGEKMDREALVRILSATFNIPPEMILEGYSMTEISVLMVRCDSGRFHIPPLIEPVVFDEELSPLEGKNLSGTFGFLDSLAVSYPGFIISGDHVRLMDEECQCGLCGPALVEIGRARNREVKGCGGIMTSFRA